MKNKRTVLRMAALSFCLLLALSVLFAPRVGIADGGGFSGGSDFGGSSSGDSCSGEGLFVLFQCARGVSEAAAESGSCSGGQIAAFWIVLIILVAIGFGVIKSVQSRRAPAPGPERTVASTLSPISDYTALDPNFSAEELKTRLENLYIKLQDCCQRRDYEPVRPYFADSLYQRFNREAQGFRAAKRTNYVDRIAVLSVDVLGYYQENGSDMIVASIYARITDYTLDDETGKLLSGSKTAEKFMTYEYTLSRPTGKITDPKHEGVSERHCPNCGAPLSVNESIKCPYCDSVLTFSDHDWTVSMIRGISQRTVG